MPFQENGDRETARTRYSKLLESPEFWESIRADWILTAQTDAYLRKPLPEILWSLDWAAAPWGWKPLMVGGSGLTFRKRSVAIELCQEPSKTFMHEDVFFSQRIFKHKKKILPLEEAKDIFSESYFVDDPVGVHQWWTYLYQSDDEEYIKKYTNIYMNLYIP